MKNLQKLQVKSLGEWAVVVERSRVSFLIDILGMLKVEHSNPGFAVYFSRDRLQSLDKNDSTRSELRPRKVTQPRFLEFDRSQRPRWAANMCMRGPLSLCMRRRVRMCMCQPKKKGLFRETPMSEC